MPYYHNETLMQGFLFLRNTKKNYSNPPNQLIKLKLQQMDQVHGNNSFLYIECIKAKKKNE